MVRCGKWAWNKSPKWVFCLMFTPKGRSEVMSQGIPMLVQGALVTYKLWKCDWVICPLETESKCDILLLYAPRSLLSPLSCYKKKKAEYSGGIFWWNTLGKTGTQTLALLYANGQVSILPRLVWEGGHWIQLMGFIIVHSRKKKLTWP